MAANCYDATTATDYWSALSAENILLQEVKTIYADATFGGTFSSQMKETEHIMVEIPKVPIAQKGNVSIHAKRWIVERTIAWKNANRRCSKDYERKTAHANAFLIIGNIKRLAKKLT